MKAKLLSVVMCVVLMFGVTFQTACTAAEVNKVVADINQYMPTVLALLQNAITIYNTVATQGDDVSRGLQTAQADLGLVQKNLETYMSKTASKADKTTAWANIQALVDTLATNADETLQLAAVKNSENKTKGVIVLASLDAAIHVLDGYIASTQDPVAVQTRMRARSVRLAKVSQLWSDSDKKMVADHLGNDILNTAVSMGF